MSTPKTTTPSVKPAGNQTQKRFEMISPVPAPVSAGGRKMTEWRYPPEVSRVGGKAATGNLCHWEGEPAPIAVCEEWIPGVWYCVGWEFPEVAQ